MDYPVEVYGHRVVETTTFPGRSRHEHPCVTTRPDAQAAPFCYWFVKLPGVGEVWCPTQLGPDGNHDNQNQANPYWWSQGTSGEWCCIHGDTVHNGVRQRTGFCDGSCGLPDVDPEPPTPDDINATVAGLLRILGEN